MLRYSVLALLLFMHGNTQAQSITTIDTTDKEFRSVVQLDFTTRAMIFEANLNAIPDKKIKRESLKSYQQYREHFSKEITKGVFIRDSLTENFLKSQLQIIGNANPEYPQINQSRLLLAAAVHPNASASGEGILMINLPLLLYTPSESELNYILCHEIAHRLLDHSYHSLLDNARLMNSEEIKEQTRAIKKNRYNKGKLSGELYRQILYSDRKARRGVEFQADSLGYLLFSKAFPGQGAAALRALSVLSIIDAERDSLSRSELEHYFTTPRQAFKPQWFDSDELAQYRYDKSPKFWTIDSLKTHPDCALRAERLKSIFKPEPSEQAKPSAVFAQIRKAIPYNNILSLHFLKAYGLSLYNCLLLLRNDPQNVWLKDLCARNLEGLQRQQSMYKLNDSLDTPDPEFSASYNTYLHLMRQFRKSEFNEILTHYQSL